MKKPVRQAKTVYFWNEYGILSNYGKLLQKLYGIKHKTNSETE
jgi:hypothetical protein